MSFQPLPLTWKRQIPSTIPAASSRVYSLALTVWWMIPARTSPYSAGPRGAQPPSASVAPQAARLTIFGFGAAASATKPEAAEMKAELIASRASLSRVSATPPAVPETLTKCRSPRGRKAART